MVTGWCVLEAMLVVMRRKMGEDREQENGWAQHLYVRGRLIAWLLFRLVYTIALVQACVSYELPFWDIREGPIYDVLWCAHDLRRNVFSFQFLVLANSYIAPLLYCFCRYS